MVVYLMNNDIKDLIWVTVEILTTLSQLCKIETGKGVDYSDVRTDLKWNLNILNNRLDDLKK